MQRFFSTKASRGTDGAGEPDVQQRGLHTARAQ
jgi:hypothetical protein